MHRVCVVDAAELAASTRWLNWLPAGDPGTYAMIEFKDLPVEAARPALDIVEQMADRYPERRLGMLCMSRLVPGQYIPQHEDRHDGKCNIRLHLPIETNPSVVFVNDTQAVHMKVGEIWQIDPTMTHCVANGGGTDRIHLFWNMRE
jgi:hypothetical protein